MHRMLELATELAREHDYDDNIGFYLCAIITKGSSIISVGYNKLARNGYVEYLSRHDKSARPFMNTHSEVAAILKARGKTDLTGCKIYVSRLKPSGGVGMARPCECCQIALAAYGIKSAYYTIDDNSYGKLNIRRNTDAVHNFRLLQEAI